MLRITSFYYSPKNDLKIKGEAMEVQVLGAGNEVGKSAILVKDRKKVLLDCGVKIQPEPPKYPELPDDIDASVISHAHLDHCGGAPMLANSQTPVYMTNVTLELVSLLIRDSIKVGIKQGYPTPFGQQQLRALIKNTKTVNYGQKFTAGDFSCSLFDAGHIPGSSGVFMNNGKKIFYTGDIQTEDSRLLRGCKLPKETDLLIIESTYSSRNHPPREKEDKRLLQAVEEVIGNDEAALIPVFAVGRAQEVLLILEKYANKIAIDGMARAASDIVSRYSHYLKDKRLKNVMKKIKFVHTDEERMRVLKKRPIIITSAGMLGGGPAIHYLRLIQKRHLSKVLFTGFLVEESPGRNLIQTKVFQNAEEKFHVHCDLQQFELSAHAGRDGLFNIIETLKPKQVITAHGEHCKEFAKEIHEKYNIEAYAPKNGESVRV